MKALYLPLAVCLALAFALVLPLPCVANRTLFSFDKFTLAEYNSNFSRVNGIGFNSTSQAIQITTHNPSNPDSAVATAAFWFLEKVRGESFSTTFTMRMSNYTFVSGVGNRDGIAFVIQTQGPSEVGAGMGGIGYGDNGAGGSGIRHSIAVEFDTYYDATLLDPTRNHYQIHTRGPEPNSANISAAVSPHKNEPFFSDNRPHTVHVIYANGNLTVVVDGALEPMTIPLDLNQLIGPISPDGVYVGFTGSTMGVGETQEILSWNYVYLGNTEAGNCVAYGPGMEASVAGQVTGFTIQAVDQFGYNITEGGDNFTVAIAAASADTSAAPVAVNVTDNGDGTYSVAYMGTTATTYTVHAAFNGKDIKGSPWGMTLAPSTIDPNQCTASGAFTGGVAGETLTLEVQARDAYANKVSEQYPDSRFVARFSNGLEANFTASQDGGGLYTAQYSIDLQGLYSIQVLFVHGSSSSPIQGSPWGNCTIVPADPAALECYAQGGGLQMAVAGDSGNFTLVARDRFNNVLHEGLPSTFAFKGSVTGGAGAALPVTIEKVEGGVVNGTATTYYTGSYTVTAAGNYSLNVFLTPPDDAHIAGSPFSISVIAGNATWGPECVAYGSGLSGGDVGRASSFVIQARDPFGNNMTDSQAHFAVVFTQRGRPSQVAAAAAAVEYNITQDPADKGKFVVSYFTTVASEYSIDVSLDDKAIKGSPFTANVQPGALIAEDCVAQGAGLTNQKEKQNMTFSISTFDLYGNALWKGGARFAVNVTDRFNGFVGVGSVVDFGNGTYQATYSVPGSGHYRLSVTTGGAHIRGSPWFFSIGGESMPETERNLIIAGSVIGSVLLIAFVVGLAILYMRRRRRQYTVLS